MEAREAKLIAALGIASEIAREIQNDKPSDETVNFAAWACSYAQECAVEAVFGEPASETEDGSDAPFLWEQKRAEAEFYDAAMNLKLDNGPEVARFIQALANHPEFESAQTRVAENARRAHDAREKWSRQGQPRAEFPFNDNGVGFPEGA